MKGSRTKASKGVGVCWRREEETYSIRDFAFERAREESVVFPPPFLHPSLSLSCCRPTLSQWKRVCWCVCASRLSRLRCCSPPPQMSWEEEGKRMYLATGKQEEFGSACETNQRLCLSTASPLLPHASLCVPLSSTRTQTHTCAVRLTHTRAGWMSPR